MTTTTRTVRILKESHELQWSRFAEWKALRDEAREAFNQSGFPIVLGTPSGYFLDVPELAQKASSIASKVRDRETKRQKRDVTVSYQIHLVGDRLMADISWSAAE